MKWVTLLLLIALGFLFLFLSGCTEKQRRSLKDTKSDYFGGLERTCTLYLPDGNTIVWSGKIDLRESDTKLSFDHSIEGRVVAHGTWLCEENL